MANVFAVHSVCSSIATLLQASYPASYAELAMPPCSFEVLSANQLAAGALDDKNRIGIHLYRITPNADQWRPRPPEHGQANVLQSLGLDLHLLVSAWGRSAQDEQVMMAWTLRQLHLHPVFDVSSLTAEAGWAADEVVQVVPAPLSTEELHGIWRAFGVPCRLGAPYLARAVRLHADPSTSNPPPVVIAPR